MPPTLKIATDSATHIEPFSVTVSETNHLLRSCNTKTYELINAGELDSYKEGKSRRVTMASIKRYIARRLAESTGPQPERGRGRPRKTDAQPGAGL